MVACLAAGYRQDCPLPLVARAAGMTPEASARLFRRTCGVTIHQYLVRLRLSHAHRLLLTTRREVLDIALDAGFGSLSRFYAAFTAAYGTTPGDLRRRAG
jgi:transcriptional regulator GlxA family with amidase domain